MFLFNSLSQIRQNSGNFSVWEKQQEDKQAQRKALYDKREYSDAELQQAKQYGKTIMNAIDVMDNHSESIAENVETTLQPLNAIVPTTATIATGILSGKYILNPVYKKIHNEKIKLLNEDAAKQLMKDIYEYNSKNSRGNWYYSPDYLTNKRVAESINDSELRRKALEYYEKYAKVIKTHKKTKILGFALIPLSLILSHIGINVLTTKMQVDSSKVARYQARKALEDPKAFVEYTPEQIAQAQEEINNNPELKKQKKKNKLKTGLFSGTFGILKDIRAYKREKAKDTDESKMVTRPLSEEEIAQAERDKEVIQRTVRLINNEAEKYSENMEVAANVLIGGTPILGGLVGGATAWVLNKTGVIKKTVDKYLNKNASKNTKELYNNLLETQNEKQNSLSRKIKVFEKWEKFYESLEHDLMVKHNPGMAADTAIGKNAVPFTEKMKNLGVALLSHKKIGGWAIAGAGALVTGAVGAIIGLQLQKSSARAGRFTAKRELEKDPRNFIGYTQKDYEEVKDVKNTEKKPSKFKEYALFIPNVLKQFFAYKKYQKHEFKENQLLQEQLMKQDVTEEQLQKATNLQRKIFNTFEKVDDNSQMYSESMEAAVEIAQPYVWYGGMALMASPLIIYLILLAKGKVSYAQAIKKFTDIFGKSSKLGNSWLFKKYLKGVPENIEHVVKGQKVNIKPVGSILGGTQLYEGSITKNMEKILENISKFPDEFAKYDKVEIDNFLYDLEKLVSKFDYEGKDELVRKIWDIRALSKEEQVEELRKLTQDADMLQDLVSKINKTFEGSAVDISKLSIKDAIKTMNQLSAFMPEKIARYFSTEKCIKELTSKIEKMSEEEFARVIGNNRSLARLGKIDKKMAISVLGNVEKVLKNIPKEEVNAIMEKCIKTFNEHPDEFIKLLRSGEISSLFRTPALENALVVAGVSWTAFSIGITYAIEAWLADLQLKAGRLGVMKSLESLDDVRYYANVEKMPVPQQP